MSSPRSHRTRLIEAVFDTLAIDPQWIEPIEDGFVWWPTEFAQRFRITPVVGEEGVDAFRIIVETDYLRDLSSSAVASFLASMHNVGAGVGCAVADGTSVRLRSSVVQPVGDIVVTMLVSAALLHASFVYVRGTRVKAREERGELAPGFAVLDRTTHPRAQGCAKPTPLLSEALDAMSVERTDGMGAVDVDLDAIAARLRATELRVEGGSSEGHVTATKRLMMLHPGMELRPVDPDEGLDTAYVHLQAAVDHRSVGWALAARTVVPVPDWIDGDGFEWARRFNDAEAVVSRPWVSIGAWQYDPQRRFWAYTTVLPHRFPFPPDADQLMDGARERANWWFGSQRPLVLSARPGS